MIIKLTEHLYKKIFIFLDKDVDSNYEINNFYFLILFFINYINPISFFKLFFFKKN